MAALLPILIAIVSVVQWSMGQVQAIQIDRSRLHSVEHDVSAMKDSIHANDGKLDQIGRDVAVITERTRWLEELRKERATQPQH